MVLPILPVNKIPCLLDWTAFHTPFLYYLTVFLLFPISGVNFDVFAEANCKGFCFSIDTLFE